MSGPVGQFEKVRLLGLEAELEIMDDLIDSLRFSDARDDSHPAPQEGQ